MVPGFCDVTFLVEASFRKRTFSSWLAFLASPSITEVLRSVHATSIIPDYITDIDNWSLSCWQLMFCQLFCFFIPEPSSLLQLRSCRCNYLITVNFKMFHFGILVFVLDQNIWEWFPSLFIPRFMLWVHHHLKHQWTNALQDMQHVQ